MLTGVSNVLKQNAGDVERVLLSVSAEVARSFVGKADEISTSVSQRAAELTRIVDDKSSGLLTALSTKSQEFASEVSRVTEHAVKAIEAKGFNFTQTMMDNSEQIARLINEASESATTAVNQSLKELQTSHTTAAETTSETVTRSIRELRETAEMATQGASKTITKTLRELQDTTTAAVEQSKQTASSAVSEIMQTQNVLHSDSTALFERLREANILLQEVLSGAHENMGEIESTLVARVADFVAAMNEVAEKTGAANSEVQRNIASFQSTSTQAISDLTQLAGQFDLHGRSLAEAVALIDNSNRRTEGTLAERRGSLEHLVSLLDGKGSDLEQRLTRFSSVLDQSLEAAAERAREVARLTADSTTSGVHAIADGFESIRSKSEEEHKHMADALHELYEQATGEATAMFTQVTDRSNAMFTEVTDRSNAMFTQAADRFAQVLEGLKQMTAEMQDELDATRGELRKGILELPQETADSAAQMRRVIVDQIEALAELNRIVARHGRGLDAAEPPGRRMETALVEAGPPRRSASEPAAGNGSARPEPSRARGDITGVAAPVIPARRAELPALSPPAQTTGNGGRTGWLSELLSRASQEAEPVVRAPAPPRDGGDGIDSLDSLAIDIARMIDHDAAADLGTAISAATATRSRVASSTPPRARRRSTRSGKSTAPTAISCARSIATSASSSACSRRSRATIAAKGWRALISPRRPARSTPCWHTRRGDSTEPRDRGENAAGARERARRFSGAPFDLLQEQLVPDLLPTRRFVGPSDWVDHHVLMPVEQGALKAARRNPAQLTQQFLTFRRQDEIGEQQCGMRMRSGPRNRDRLRAADQRFDRDPVDRSALALEGIRIGAIDRGGD